MNLQEILKKGKEKLLSFGIKQWGLLLLAGICCIIIAFPTKTEKEEQAVNDCLTEQSGTKREEADYVAELEKRLSALLSEVAYVGKTKVMISVDQTVQKNVLQDENVVKEEIREQDSAGGSRTSNSESREETTVFYGIGGESTPYILSESYPKITGVVVIAEGSGTGTVDLDIMNAVQVLFDVPAHKIKIMKMK